MKIDFNQGNLSSHLTMTQLENIYKSVFNTENGRMILDDLSIKCHLMSSTLYDNSNYMYYLEGQKSLFLYICSWLDEKKHENVSEDDHDEDNRAIINN